MSHIIKKAILRFSPRIKACSFSTHLKKEIPAFPEELFTIPSSRDCFGRGKGFEGYSAKIPPYGVRIYANGICDSGREEVFATRRKVVAGYTSQAANPRLGERPAAKSAIRKIRGSVAHLALSGLEDNYYHWCVEFMARLHILNKSGQTPDYYIVPMRTAFQKEYVALLGIPESKIIEAREGMWIRAEKLVVPSLINNWEMVLIRNYPCYSKIYLPHWIGEVFKSIRLNDYSSKHGRKLYISRRRARYRRILNEEELIEVLRNEGYSAIDLDDMSVREQVATFRNADRIIGVHGAGLVNILHCAGNVALFELFPEYYHDPGFRILCNAIGAEYACMAGTTADTSMHPQQEDFVINVDEFRKKVGSFQREKTS